MNKYHVRPFVLYILAMLSQTSVATTLNGPGNPAVIKSDSTCWVTLHDGLLSIEPQETEWTNLLAEMTRCTRMHIHRAEPLSGSVSPAISKVPLRQAFKQLFGPEADFIFRYSQHTPGADESTTPSEVWVLGPVKSDLPGPGTIKIDSKPFAKALPLSEANLQAPNIPVATNETALGPENGD